MWCSPRSPSRPSWPSPAGSTGSRSDDGDDGDDVAGDRTEDGGPTVSERSRLCLVVRQVLVLSLLGTLLGRLWYVQVAAAENYKTAAAENGTREIITPAPRGMILDSRGRPLARNRTALVVSIS